MPDLNLLLNKYFISHQTNEVLGFASRAQSCDWEVLLLAIVQFILTDVLSLGSMKSWMRENHSGPQAVVFSPH